MTNSNTRRQWKPVETSNFYNNEPRQNEQQDIRAPKGFSKFHQKLKRIHSVQTSTTSHVRDSFLRWNVYSKQELAFDAMHRIQEEQKQNQDGKQWDLKPCIFSFEYDPNHVGRRKFVVTTYRDFWSRYRSLPHEQRHFYEIIREDAPCHLYFDLEYQIPLNQDKESNILMEKFKLILSNHLMETFGIPIVVSRDMIDLTSTTEKKFSRHLIVHIPGAMFKNNAHMGAYVNAFVKQCLNEPENKLFWVKIEQQAQQQSEGEMAVAVTNTAPFLDMAVYTKNRSFRIWKSFKMGKCVSLEFIDPSFMEAQFPSEYEQFLQTLVCAPLVQDLASLKLLEFGVSSESIQKPGKETLPSSNSTSWTYPSSNSFAKSKCSPFPQIDHYMIYFINSRSPSNRAFIRSCSYQSETKTIFYLIGGNRFCHNISRNHKSNGVYYVVWLEESIFRQRCFDPDCRQFQSVAFPLPLDMNPFINFDFETEEEKDEEEDEFSEIPDEILLAEVERIERNRQGRLLAS